MSFPNLAQWRKSFRFRVGQGGVRLLFDTHRSGGVWLWILIGVIAFTLLYVWLLLHRTRVMAMEDLLDDQGLDAALEARRAEALTERGA